MEFGLFVNTERPGRSPAATIEEDLWEVVTADKVGLHEAWISEHDWPAEFLIAQAARLTNHIKLGAGVRPIAFYHPLQVALEANVCDQLTNGRYMLGFGFGGPGGGAQKMRQWGLGDDGSRRRRMNEAVDLILRALSATEAFDYNGEFWSGQDIRLTVASIQHPHVPVGVANALSRDTAELAGRLGLISLRSQLAEPSQMRALTEAYFAASKAASREPRAGEIRASKFVWVARTTHAAKEELRASITDMVDLRKRNFPQWFQSILPESGDVWDITWDDIVDSGYYFVGDPDRVCELIQRYHDESGGFGVFLLVGGKDIATREQRARSMQLFAENVAPQLRSLGC